MEWITDPQAWIALLTLTVLEIVLGIDNIVFISILAGKLPAAQQDRARRVGLAVALITRVLLLSFIFFLAHLGEPAPTNGAGETPSETAGEQGGEVETHGAVLFTALGQEVSIRDIILFLGGLFLLYKATKEIHDKLEGDDHETAGRAAASFASVIVQIALLDIVFSVDSVITAVGMADHLAVMIAAIVIAIGIMMFASGPISHFVHRHPTVKMLALSFLLMIGLTLIVEAFHVEIPKGYIYFAMGFSIFVEMLNLRVRSGGKPVDLHQDAVLPEGKASK
jgi:predicted tellurium resistance membrane protein TerC